VALTRDDFDYELPAERIAQAPVSPRDSSRLMVLDRRTGRRAHHVFRELPGLLGAGDVLVLNDTRVVAAKFACRRRTGGRIEGLFLRELSRGEWEVMLKGAGRCKPGEELSFVRAAEVKAVLLASAGEGIWHLGVSGRPGAPELLQRVGTTPLPPYIRRPGRLSDSEDRQRYQTVYAADAGAVAAPTAGLHFTEALLDATRARGVETVFVTLHVGLGTFAPVKAERLDRHRMHAEFYRLGAEAAGAIAAAKGSGRRVVAVGTTSVRVLEATAAAGPIAAGEGWTDVFIHPPAEFRVVDALLTNFHLPRSTLLMLVAAFCAPGATDGVGMILDAYTEAIEEGYRFYSYGDAMLIL